MPVQGPCHPACTKIVKFMTDHEVPPSVGVSLPSYKGIEVIGPSIFLYDSVRRRWMDLRSIWA